MRSDSHNPSIAEFNKPFYPIFKGLSLARMFTLAVKVNKAAPAERRLDNPLDVLKFALAFTEAAAEFINEDGCIQVINPNTGEEISIILRPKNP